MILFIGVALYVHNTVTSELLSVTTPVGSENLSNITANTIGKINTAFLNQANLMGVLLLLGMVGGMIFGAYLSRGRSPMIFLVVDIILMIFAYVIATYLANAYETILISLPFKSIFVENLNQASTFVLKLPLIVVITGVLIMIVSYSGIPKAREEEVAGF